MKRYRFEIRQELITPLEVMADTEREARERVVHSDNHVTPFDTLYGDLSIELCLVIDE